MGINGESKRLYYNAIQLASYYYDSEVKADHLVFAAMGSANPVIRSALDEAGLTYDRFIKYQSEKLERSITGSPVLSAEFVRTIEEFEEEAVISSKMDIYGDVDLLAFALSRPYNDFRSFDFMMISKGKILASIFRRLDTERQKSLGQCFKGVQVNVDAYCKDISAMATAGEIDPMIGRNKELERVIQILGRRRKNNPVILGSAGTGKTCLVEGLALAIANKDPRVKTLWKKRIVELDLHLMLAGTKYRGQFEERLTGLIKELENDPDTIVFVDEVHVVMGAGKVEGGAGDAANMLKPSLARGRIQMIGATTNDEYSFIKNDPALERRFQPVELHELTDEEIIEILHGIKKAYEKFHDVTYQDEAIEAALTFGKKVPKRHAPDVQIDLLDETASRHKGETITAKMIEDVFNSQMHSSQNKEKKLGFA